MTNQVSIGDVKLAEIVKFVHLTRAYPVVDEDAVREVIVADRMGRAAYQHWLDNAPAELIAAWVVAELSRPPHSRR